MLPFPAIQKQKVRTNGKWERYGKQACCNSHSNVEAYNVNCVHVYVRVCLIFIVKDERLRC